MPKVVKKVRSKVSFDSETTGKDLRHGCQPFFLTAIDLELRGLSAKWSDWRLVVDGVEYPPKFNSYEEWAKQNAEGRDEEN